VKDLSLHLLDLLENSAKAGASLATLRFTWGDDLLRIRIEDDGPGFPACIGNDPSSPFSTTRTTRKVGLGLPLFREAAEQTGGEFRIGKSLLGGVLVEATFHMSHIDAKPLGNIGDTLLIAIRSWPNLNFAVSLCDGDEAAFDTRPIRAELGDIPLSEPEVLGFLRESLAAALAPLYAWAQGQIALLGDFRGAMH
jgi:hypothetical protein